jgi:hypothetical protein
MIMYCDMTPESRNSSLLGYGGRGSRGNVNARNNRRTTVTKQRRGKHSSVKIDKLLGNCVFYVVRAEIL